MCVCVCVYVCVCVCVTEWVLFSVYLCSFSFGICIPFCLSYNFIGMVSFNFFSSPKLVVVLHIIVWCALEFLVLLLYNLYSY